MEDPYLVELNVCHFKGQQTEAVYTCFKNELCCDEGCCPKSTFNIFRVWYFWITVIGLLFILSGGCKFCKFENRRRQLSAARRSARNSARLRGNSAVPVAHRSLEMYFGNSRRNELDELINLRQLLVQHEACNVAIDRYVACQNARARDGGNAVEPPSYNSLQLKTTQFNVCDPPPNYSTVCRNFRGISEMDGGGLHQAVERARTELSAVHAQVSGQTSGVNVEHPPQIRNNETH